MQLQQQQQQGDRTSGTAELTPGVGGVGISDLRDITTTTVDFQSYTFKHMPSARFGWTHRQLEPAV